MYSCTELLANHSAFQAAKQSVSIANNISGQSLTHSEKVSDREYLEFLTALFTR